MTTTGIDPAPPKERPRRPASGGRRILRQRSLPGGRAVVGALLIAAAAVLVFAAYLDATAEPSTRYLVASDPIPAGTVVSDLATAESLFSSAPLALVDSVAERAVGTDDLESLIGQTVVANLERGDLLQRSALLDGQRVAGLHVMSFSVPVADALAGSLSPGETIDVLATSRGGGERFTAYIVRGVPLLAADGGGTGSSLVLTVALDAAEQVQALGHAVKTADVFVVSTLAVDADAADPPPYTGVQGPGGAETGGASEAVEPDAEVEDDDG